MARYEAARRGQEQEASKQEEGARGKRKQQTKAESKLQEQEPRRGKRQAKSLADSRGAHQGRGCKRWHKRRMKKTSRKSKKCKKL